MNINEIHKPVNGKTYNVPLDFLEHEVEKIDLDPDYQRGHVWSQQEREEFVGFILEGGETSPLVVNVIDYEDKGEKRIVDGKQRITSLLMWLKNKIPAKLSSGKTVYRDDVEGSLMGVQIHIKNVKMTREEVLSYYIKMNRGGVIHSDEEIRKVRDMLIEESDLIKG